MEVAISLASVSLTLLGSILLYMWRTNGEIHRQMMAVLERVEEGQREIANVARGVAQGQRELTQMVAQGQRESAQIHKEITQMLLTQTSILERIQARA